MTPRRVATDAALTIAMAAVITVCILLRQEDDSRAPTLVAHLLGLGIAALLPLRRRWPLGVLLGSWVLLVLYHVLDYPATGMAIALSVALYAAAAGGRAPWAFGLVAFQVLSSSWYRYGVEGEPATALLSTGSLADIALMVALVLLGDAVRSRRALTGEVAERLRREADRRVAEERLRIARELHDVLAHRGRHHRAGRGGPRRARRRPGRGAPGAAGDPGRLARGAGGAVGHRRRPARPRPGPRGRPPARRPPPRPGTRRRRCRGGPGRGGRGPRRRRAPAPAGLAGPAPLVARARASALAPTLHEELEGGLLPPAHDLAAYRIVQESVTNVLRHAAATAVEVRLTRGCDAVGVTVTDDGAGSGPAPGSGDGLTGMRERAAALGGRLEAGPLPGGGFRVAARLPLAAPAAAG